MGAKGPLFIFFLGCAAVAAFGLLGKLVVDESPQAHALVEFCDHLSTTHGADRVQVEHADDDAIITLYAARDLIDRPADPTAFRATFVRDFRQIYNPQRTPKRLQIVSKTAGGGCTSSRELWRDEVDLATEQDRVVKELAKLLGFAPTLEVKGPGVLRLESSRSIPQGKARDVVRVVAKLWGGGWEQIEVRSAGKLRRYAPDGSPAKRQRTPQFQPAPRKGPTSP